MHEPILNETFGLLKWDPLLQCFLGGIDWPHGLHTEVALWTSDNRLERDFAQAYESLTWLKHHEQRIRTKVAEQSVSIYNDAWRNQVEPISVDEFAHCIEILRVGFKDDGSLLLSYDAHEMFGGHVLDALFDAERSLRGVDLIG